MHGPPSDGRPELAALEGELRLQALRSVMLHSAVAGRLGIAVVDFNCLNLLSLDGPQTPGQLAARLGLTRGGAVTAMIDRLEASGYVRRHRDPDDRRKVLIELQERATQSIAPLLGALGSSVQQLLQEYPEREIALLLAFVSKLSVLTAQTTEGLREGAAK